MHHSILQIRHPGLMQFQPKAAPKLEENKEVKKMLEISHTPDVFEFRFNRPKKLNAIDLDMTDIFNARLKEWKKNKWSEAPRVVILAPGENHRAFSAGGDVTSMYTMALGPNPSYDSVDYGNAREYLVHNKLAEMKPF